MYKQHAYPPAPDDEFDAPESLRPRLACAAALFRAIRALCSSVNDGGADTNSGATDKYNDDCAAWIGFVPYCSPESRPDLAIDDGDFTLQDMCCACGGGSYV